VNRFELYFSDLKYASTSRFAVWDTTYIDNAHSKVLKNLFRTKQNAVTQTWKKKLIRDLSNFYFSPKYESD